MAKRFEICAADELPVGERKIVEVGGRSIGVFNIDGRYYAIRNLCPHQMAPLCEGRVSGTTLPSAPNEYRYGHEGEIIRCPWHGWEFNTKTGQSVFNPHRMRVKTYQVTVEGPDGDAESCEVGADDPDPSVETFEVKVEARMVVVYI